MKKVVFSACTITLLLLPIAFFAPAVESSPRLHGALAPTPAPVLAGGGIAAAIGLVGAPADWVFALRGGETTDFWRYSISQNSWETLPATPASVSDGGGIVAVASYVFCSSGQGPSKFGLATLRGGNTRDFWVFDIFANRWCAGPQTPAPIGEGGAIAQKQRLGKIYVLRGGGTNEFWEFDIANWRDEPGKGWKQLASAPGPVSAGGGLVGINYGTHSQRDKLYALQGGGSTAVWKYDIDTDTWTHQADTPAPIGAGGAVTASNVGGGAEGTLIILQGGGAKTAWALQIGVNENVWRDINDAPTAVTAGGAVSAQVNGCDFALVGGGSDQFFATGLRNCLVTDPVSPPDFSLGFAEPEDTAARGTKVKARLTVARVNGFTGNVRLLPPTEKLQGIIVPAELPAAVNDTIGFKIKVKVGAQPGTHQLLFTGRDESGKVRQTTLTLTVQ